MTKDITKNIDNETNTKATKRKLLGKVVSNKMVKTVVVSIETPKRHPLYAKFVRNTKKYKARCEDEVKVGDVVEITETKPYSKSVYFKVTGKVNA